MSRRTTSGNTRIQSPFRPTRNITSLVGCAAAAVLVTACAGSTTPGSDSAGGSPKDPGTVTVAYVPGVSNLPYFDTAFRGAVGAAKKYGYKVEYVPVPEYDATTQTNALNAELAARPDFLLLSAVDDVSLRPAVQRYLAAGIPVIAVGGTLKNSDGLFAQIATDNYQGGRIAAQALGRQLNGSGTIATLNIAPGSATIEDRVKGFAETMRQEFPGIKVLDEEYGGGTVPSNQQALRALMLAHPDIDAVFGATEVNTEGAAAAVAALGKTGTIRVAGFDASPEQVKQLRAGRIDFLSVSQPAAQLTQAIDLVHAYLGGDRTAKPLVTVPNVGVTRDNVDDPATTPLLYTSGN
ncbi:ABC transporter substrate-binding protein [Embleya sp. NBC_00888]|uniref:ABC transporter substrate-binding protein n=1 Tax=Embleya sp. NBC_00888 TaxID=2975960 RepID=UPI003868CAEF|nr:ABC transporter substrate-binding protein [Embleya sp. NBC_00888]